MASSIPPPPCSRLVNGFSRGTSKRLKSPTLRVTTVSRAIQGEDVEGGAHLIEPALDLTGFCGVLFAGAFDPGLDLTDGHAGEMELGVGDTLNPSDDRAISWHPTIDKGVRQYEIKPVLSPSAGGSPV